MRYWIFFLFILPFVLFNVQQALATDQILITKSFTMDEIIFDGKWSFYTEWKKSSLDTINNGDGTVIQLRTAHIGKLFVSSANVAAKLFNMGHSVTLIPSREHLSTLSTGNCSTG